jgi:hypothetical protein
VRYYEGDKIKEDDVIWTCSTHGEVRNAYKILVRKLERTRLLGRRRCRWEDNIKIDLKNIYGVWTGFILPRLGFSHGQTNLQFHKRRRVSWLAEWLSASQRLRYMELVLDNLQFASDPTSVIVSGLVPTILNHSSCTRQFVTHRIVQSDYKWCEWLHKFTGKNRSHHL